MLVDLTPEQTSLANLMVEISERCYCAGWMTGLEFVLWEALLNGPREYGQHKITEKDIASLKALSTQTGCWIFFDTVTEETAIDLTAWRVKYDSEKDKGSKFH